MKHKITISILLFSVLAYAQVPGYMGKRMVVGYSNYMSPSLLYPTANSTESYELGINTTHCINVEYSIKKRTNFCFGVQFFKTGLQRETGFEYNQYDPIYGYSYYGTANYYARDKKPMELKTTNISFGFKFFNHGSIAPVGKYQKLEFLLLFDKVKYDRTAFYMGSPIPENKIIGTIGRGEYDFKSFAIALTLGKQRVLFDAITLDTGVRFGISPNAVLNFISDDMFSNYSNSTFENQLKINMNSRILTSQLVNFHIGIGFLAF